MSTAKKFYIQTFGCQMNLNDSERIMGLMQSLGLQETKKTSEADVIFVNSCSVRQSAEDRVYGMIYNWQELRKEKPNLIIAITGCMPGRDHDGKIQKKIEGVDLFFPIHELSLLPKRLRELNPDLFSNDPENLEDYFTINPSRKESHRAYVAIQTGCNNFCTYCVVPLSRGRENNRSIKSIMAEIEKAVEGGAKEIVLLGQVVNNYVAPDPENFCSCNPFFNETIPLKEKKDKKFNKGFPALLWEINQVEGVERLHWTAADPQYFNEYLIQALTLPKQVNYLHLPVQSGDNEVLKRMNRHYTREYYIDLVKKIRAVRPDIALGTDIIVGFCGETDEQFQNTVDLYKQCDFDIAYLAQYSERSGTAAAKAFKDDVLHEIKKKRWDILQNLMEEIVEKKNKKYLGQKISVLVDKWENGVCTGNSGEMKFTQFLGGRELVGQVAELDVTEPEMWRLKGTISKKTE